MFEKSNEDLEKIGALNTIREIENQPFLFLETLKLYKENLNRIEKFFNNIKEIDDKILRVIFTGAGSSEYAGNVLCEYLKTKNYNKMIFESIATTDIVSCPYNYLKKDEKICLISFARSGNSPESLKAVELCNQLVDNIYHLAITCAKDGKLAKNLMNKDNSLVLLTPYKSNDKGFAMTSSFTCMFLYALLIFDDKNLNLKENLVNKVSKCAKKMIEDEDYIANIVINNEYNRVVYLGSGIFSKLAREASLKLLELTAGDIISVYESSMGFRHGPKSIIDNKTIILSFISKNDYTKLYDLDILNEIENDKIAIRVQGISHRKEKLTNCYSFDNDICDIYQVLDYIVFAHIFAVMTSLKVLNRPDTPSKTNTVNRVVKGVVIHNYNV